MAVPIKKAPVSEMLNFGDPDSGLYSMNYDLPEGDYVWTDVDVRMWAGFNAEKSNNTRLGVMITFVPLSDPAADPKQVFYSMGTKASESFAPDPNTGKGIISTGQGSGTLPNKTNWAELRDSLYSAGLPKGIFTNDVSVFIGMHAHMRLIPEPAERKDFKSSTGEAPTQEVKFTRNISIVGEILDSGKPWEGTGGLPEVGKGKAKPPLKTAPKAAAKPAPVEERDPEPEEIDDEVKTAAQGGLAEILTNLPVNSKTGKTAPVAKAGLKVKAAAKIKAMFGDDMFNSVAAAWESDDVLEVFLSELGFTVEGPMVKPL